MPVEPNLRLHEVDANGVEVMEAFPREDRAKDLKNLDLSCDTPPVQSSL